MSLLPLSALAGAAAGSMVVRSTAEAARELVAARPFSHLLSAGHDVLATGSAALRETVASSGEQPSEIVANNDPLAALREEARAALALLAGRLLERLQQAGLDTSLPLELEVSTNGEVQILSTHPQREAVERLIAGDRELGELASYVEATQRMLHTSDTHRTLMVEEAGRTLGSLERRAEELAEQPLERLVVRLDRGKAEVEFR